MSTATQNLGSVIFKESDETFTFETVTIDTIADQRLCGKDVINQVISHLCVFLNTIDVQLTRDIVIYNLNTANSSPICFQVNGNKLSTKLLTMYIIRLFGKL